MDHWNPGLEEIKYFTNLVHHCDVLVTTASTLSLDLVSYNKPIINLAYGGLFDKHTGEDITRTLYYTDHSQWVVNTGAVEMVGNLDELLAAIEKYFKHPEYKQKERDILLELLCYRVDGRCSERIVDVITDQINK